MRRYLLCAITCIVVRGGHLLADESVTETTFTKDDLIDISPARQAARLDLGEPWAPQKLPVPVNVFADQLG